MQSVPITTDVVSSNIDQGEVYNIMRLATGRWFSPGHLVSSSNKTDLHDIIEILMLHIMKHQTNILFIYASIVLYFWILILYSL